MPDCPNKWAELYMSLFLTGKSAAAELVSVSAVVFCVTLLLEV